MLTYKVRTLELRSSSVNEESLDCILRMISASSFFFSLISASYYRWQSERMIFQENYLEVKNSCPLHVIWNCDRCVDDVQKRHLTGSRRYRLDPHLESGMMQTSLDSHFRKGDGSRAMLRDRKLKVGFSRKAMICALNFFFSMNPEAPAQPRAIEKERKDRIRKSFGSSTDAANIHGALYATMLILLLIPTSIEGHFSVPSLLGWARRRETAIVACLQRWEDLAFDWDFCILLSRTRWGEYVLLGMHFKWREHPIWRSLQLVQYEEFKAQFPEFFMFFQIRRSFLLVREDALRFRHATTEHELSGRGGIPVVWEERTKKEEEKERKGKIGGWRKTERDKSMEKRDQR